MSIPIESKIAYLPSGEMATALAIKGHDNGYRGVLWNHSEIAHRYYKRYNASRRLRGIKLDGIEATHDIEEAMTGAKVIFLAPRSEDFLETIRAARPYISEDAILVTVVKGFVEVNGDFDTPSQIIKREIEHASDRVVFLAGPNIARQMAQGKLTGTTLVAHHRKTAEDVKQVIHKDDVFRVDIYEGDLVHVEAVAAFKNVAGLIMGFARTLSEYSENTAALILQKGLAEAAMLCEAAGGDPRAIMELVGVGDYGLLMNSRTSRNVRAGIAFGQGKIDLEGLLKSDTTIEGVRTVRALRGSMRQYGVYLPLAMAVYRVLYTGRDPAYAVRRLLFRNE